MPRKKILLKSKKFKKVLTDSQKIALLSAIALLQIRSIKKLKKLHEN